MSSESADARERLADECDDLRAQLAAAIQQVESVRPIIETIIDLHRDDALGDNYGIDRECDAPLDAEIFRFLDGEDVVLWVSDTAKAEAAGDATG